MEQGIGPILALVVVDRAREHSLSFLPVRSYVKGFIQKHPKYQDLLKRKKEAEPTARLSKSRFLLLGLLLGYAMNIASP